MLFYIQLSYFKEKTEFVWFLAKISLSYLNKMVYHCH